MTDDSENTRRITGVDTRIAPSEADAVVKSITSDGIKETRHEQVTEFATHEAFRNQIRVMPDAHVGAGAPIGFTMGLYDRVVSNVVGVDIGCGMLNINIGHVSDIEDPADIDEEIRDAVPMGRSVHFDTDYHMSDEFLWDICEQTNAHRRPRRLPR
jgi:RNA-splicing ligase RtcB